jgi:hypothetical protein
MGSNPIPSIVVMGFSNEPGIFIIHTTEMYARRINLEYRNSALHECCTASTKLLGNTDYRVTN